MRRRPEPVPLPSHIDGILFDYVRRIQDRPNPAASYYFAYSAGNEKVPLRTLKLMYGANASGSDVYLQLHSTNRALVTGALPDISILVPDGATYSYTPSLGGRQWPTSGIWWAVSTTPSSYTATAFRLTFHAEGFV